MTATKSYEQECPVLKTTTASKEVESSPITTNSDTSDPVCTPSSTNTIGTSTHPAPATSIEAGLVNGSGVTEPSKACTAVDEANASNNITVDNVNTGSSTNSTSTTTDSSTNTAVDSSTNTAVGSNTTTAVDSKTDALEEANESDVDNNDDVTDDEELGEESDDDSDVMLQREEGIEDMSNVDVPRLLEIEEKLKNNKDFKGAARITEYICYKLNEDPAASAGNKAETLLRCGDYMLRAIEASEDFLNPVSLDQASTTGVPDFLGFFVVALGVYDKLILHDVEIVGLPSNLFYGPVLTNLTMDMLKFLETLEFKRKDKDDDEGLQKFVTAFYNKQKEEEITGEVNKTDDKKDDKEEDKKEEKKEKEEVKDDKDDDSKSSPAIDKDSHEASNDAYDIEASSIPPTNHDIERLMYLYLRMGDGFQSIESHGQALLFYLRCFALVYISGIRDHRLLSPLISLAQELQWTGLHTLASRVLTCYIRLLNSCSEDYKIEGSSIPESVYSSIPQSLEDANLMLSETKTSLEKGDVIPSRLSSERQKALFNAVGDVNDTDVGTKATYDASTVPAEEVKEVRVKRKGEEAEREVKVAKKD